MERLHTADAAEAAPNGPAAARSEPSAEQAAKVPLPPQADAATKRTAGRTRKSAAPAKLVCDHCSRHCGGGQQPLLMRQTVRMQPPNPYPAPKCAAESQQRT